MPGAYSYLWNDANSKWEPAPAAVLTKRMTAVGQVAAGAHKLYWIIANPSAANANMELTDAVAGGAGIALDTFYSSRQSHEYPLHPSMQFSTGIYLETFTNLTSVIFGYI